MGIRSIALVLSLFAFEVVAAEFTLKSGEGPDCFGEPFKVGDDGFVRVLLWKRVEPALTQKDIDKAMEQMPANQQEAFLASVQSRERKEYAALRVVLKNVHVIPLKEFSQQNLAACELSLNVDGNTVASARIFGALESGIFEARVIETPYGELEALLSDDPRVFILDESY